MMSGCTESEQKNIVVMLTIALARTETEQQAIVVKLIILPVGPDKAEPLLIAVMLASPSANH